MAFRVTISSRVHGRPAEPIVTTAAYLWDGAEVVERVVIHDMLHLVSFNCFGALGIENFIDFARRLHPGIPVSYSIDEAPSIGEVVNSVAMDVNRKISEGAAS